MATYSPNVSEKGPTPLSNDAEVINLRPLLDTFIRWWREILLLTIIAAAIGGALAYYVRLQVPPSYEASSQIAIARIVSNVNLDNSIQTAMNDVGGTLDNAARRASLLGLVSNGMIANAVIEELGPLVDGLTASELLEDVEAEYVGEDISDLMEISVVADTPELAATIANLWAKHYIEHINTLYGEMPSEMTDVIEQEVGIAQSNYDAAQQAYEDFLNQNDIPTLTREIEEKRQFIDTLQSTRQIGLSKVISQTLGYRQSIIDTYFKTVQENRLLALTGEQEANRTLVQSFIDAISENRLLAFTTEHEARVALFTQYADLELQNRLLALQQEQETKSQLFDAYSNADLQAKLSVFNQQVYDKVGSLVTTHATKRRIEQLLDEARALQTQIEQAGEAGARSNSLPLLLLKIEAYAATATDTVINVDGTAVVNDSNLQLDLSTNSSLEVDIEKQRRDIAVLIETLTARAAELEARIEEESLSLFNNEGYQLLDGERPEDDPLYAAIQEQYLALFDLDELAQTEDSIPDDSVLSQAILAKYDELFGLGTLASASMTISNTTPIYAALQAQYPSLFAVGDLTELGELLAADSALNSASQEKLIELLQPSDDLASYLAATDVSAQPILQLEGEIRQQQAELERKQAQHDRLIENRNLALEAYTMLKNKVVELTLRRTAAGREVRLAATANPPDSPMPQMNLVLTGVAFGFAGFLIAVIIAILASYMDAQPFLSRLRPSQVRPASQASR